MDERAVLLAGEKVKEQRLIKSWSQQKLADATGLSKRTIENVERNRNASLLHTVHSIAEALEVEPSDLMGEVELPPQSLPEQPTYPNTDMQHRTVLVAPNRRKWVGLKIFAGFSVLLILVGFVMESRWIEHSDIKVVQRINKLQDEMYSVVSTKYNEIKQSYLKIEKGVSDTWEFVQKIKPYVLRMIDDKEYAKYIMEKAKDKVPPTESSPNNDNDRSNRTKVRNPS